MLSENGRSTPGICLFLGVAHDEMIRGVIEEYAIDSGIYLARGVWHVSLPIRAHRFVLCRQIDTDRKILNAQVIILRRSAMGEVLGSGGVVEIQQYFRFLAASIYALTVRLRIRQVARLQRPLCGTRLPLCMYYCCTPGSMSSCLLLCTIYV